MVYIKNLHYCVKPLQNELIVFFKRKDHQEIIQDLKKYEITVSICSQYLKVERKHKFYTLGIIKDHLGSFMWVLKRGDFYKEYGLIDFDLYSVLQSMKKID